MAELLVQWVDKVPTSHPLYAHNYCAGDVITVQEDGWPWTDAEVNNPQWRIVEVPGVAASSFAMLVAPRQDQMGALLRKRDQFLDKTSIPPAILNAIENGKRSKVPPGQAISAWAKARSGAFSIG